MDSSLEGPGGRFFPGGQDRVKGAFNLVDPKEERGRYPTPRLKRMRGETALEKSNKAKTSEGEGVPDASILTKINDTQRYFFLAQLRCHTNRDCPSMKKYVPFNLSVPPSPHQD